MLESLPVFGVCGFSGAGKTTLIEKMVERLRARGLRMAVAKHDVHGIDIDRPGKDSDRFYRAGADVLLSAPEEEVLRAHRGDRNSFLPRLLDLAGRCDVVLVEGRKHTELPKIWLLGEGEAAPPPEVTNILAVLPRDSNRATLAGPLLEDLVERRCRTFPVMAGVLIGGKSSRMGRPKHRLVSGGRSWLRRTIDVLTPLCQRVVILGDGDLPDDVPGDVARLPDVAGVEGPLGGALAAMRWAPHVSWLLAACDLPGLSEAAVRWLLGTRTPGRWATLPALSGSGRCEPLLAHYDFRARALFERMAGEGVRRMSALADHAKAAVVPVPAELAPAWKNCNRPADVATT